MLTIGVIGGTGVADLTEAMPADHTETTPYGEVSLQVAESGVGTDRRRLVLLSRHGPERNLPPHRINYRANIQALKQMGCSAILSTAATGSLRKDWPPGSLVLINQFLDFTKSRVSTFYENDLRQPIHVDMTEPYCPRLRGLIKEVADLMALPLADGGTYVCAEGPRFETPAEIRMFAQLGGDLVGMTQVPEVVLAREAEMCYANVSIVTNFAAGILPQPLTHHEVLEVMERELPRLTQLLLDAARQVDKGDCACRHALDEYRNMAALQGAAEIRGIA